MKRSKPVVPPIQIPLTAQDGMVAVHLEVRVPQSEMSAWRPETISRFFAGIAMAKDARAEGRAEASAVQTAVSPSEMAELEAFMAADSNGE